MPRERSGVSYTELAAEAPGAIPKPRAKRDRAEGRTTPGSSLRSYSTLKQSSAPLAHHGRPEEVDGEQCEACRLLPCCICGAPPPSVPHHFPKVSHGGLDRDATPMCSVHHEETEAIPGMRFWRKHGVDPRAVQEAVRDWMNAGWPQGNMPWGKR
jgi:hypothetical protein